MLSKHFYNQDACLVARKLLGKVLRVKYRHLWLSAMIIETEAYYLHDKASHASLGFTQKRRALFMPPGTIYMYYARGGDSLNISVKGKGNAVLIKSAIPFLSFPPSRNSAYFLPSSRNSPKANIRDLKIFKTMQQLNPLKNKLRPIEKLCSGQTLLCKSLNLKVKTWDQQPFDKNKFYIENVDYVPQKIIQTKRLGIPKGRDEHLLYRFIDATYLDYCTRKPKEYLLIS